MTDTHATPDPIANGTNGQVLTQLTRGKRAASAPALGGTDFLAMHRDATEALHAEFEANNKRNEQILSALGLAQAPSCGVVTRTTAEARPAKLATPAGASRERTAAAKPKGERLARRSSGDLDTHLAKIVGHLRDIGHGLRAEQIRSELGFDKKELPRVLKLGLTSGALAVEGQKRASTYSVA